MQTPLDIFLKKMYTRKKRAPKKGLTNWPVPVTTLQFIWKLRRLGKHPHMYHIQHKCPDQCCNDRLRK